MIIMTLFIKNLRLPLTNCGLNVTCIVCTRSAPDRLYCEETSQEDHPMPKPPKHFHSLPTHTHTPLLSNKAVLLLNKAPFVGCSWMYCSSDGSPAIGWVDRLPKIKTFSRKDLTHHQSDSRSRQTSKKKKNT